MWETIKNDPLLKAVTIIVLGVLAFGFAFNIMFGSGGASLNANIGYTLSVLIKIVLIVAVFEIIVLAVRQVNKYAFQNNKFNYEEFKNDPLAKQTVISIAVLIGLSIIYSMFYGRTGTYGEMMSQTGMGEDMMGTGSAAVRVGVGVGTSAGIGINGGLGTTAILLILVKILLVISVVGLIIGLVMYLKNGLPKQNVNLFRTERIPCGNCGYAAAPNQKFCPECGSSLAPAHCEKCGLTMKPEWKCCPECGHENTGSTEEIPKSTIDITETAETTKAE